MNKNLQIVIGIATLVIAASVSYYFLIFLPKTEQTNVEQQQAEIENTQKYFNDAFSRMESLLEAQGFCSESASNYFENSGYKLGMPLFYDYFNEELNKCFILIRGSKIAGIHNIEVVEVYKNKVYGIYSYQSSKVIACNVLNATCKNKDEFFKLLKPYIPLIDMYVAL